MTESAVIGLAGGILGAVVAALVVRVVRAPPPVPGPTNMYGTLGDFASVQVDLTVLGFTLLASIAAAVLSGLVPALHAGRTDLAAELKDRSGTTGGSKPRRSVSIPRTSSPSGSCRRASGMVRRRRPHCSIG
jgi:putative ABC transport system permease protein